MLSTVASARPRRRAGPRLGRVSSTPRPSSRVPGPKPPKAASGRNVRVGPSIAPSRNSSTTAAHPAMAPRAASNRVKAASATDRSVTSNPATARPVRAVIVRNAISNRVKAGSVIDRSVTSNPATARPVRAVIVRNAISSRAKVVPATDRSVTSSRVTAHRVRAASPAALAANRAAVRVPAAANRLAASPAVRAAAAKVWMGS
ncbi:hypothetical protein D3C80_1277490 [compost metagenome]